MAGGTFKVSFWELYGIFFFPDNFHLRLLESMDVEPTDMEGQLCLFLDKWQVKQNGFFDWLRPIMICPLAAGHFAA